jgi:hypothetical protein
MLGGKLAMVPAMIWQWGTVNLRRDRLPASGKAATGSA